MDSVNNTNTSAIGAAVQGIQIQQQRFEQNVEKVADTEAFTGRDSSSQDRALLEQGEIVNGFQANARSLQAAGERIGTILDIRV